MYPSGEVTAAQIARIAGVGRAAVSNWRKRYDDFPAPVGGTPSSPTFRLEEVEHWLNANNRAPLDDTRSHLRRALRSYGERGGDRGVADDVIARLAPQLLRPIPVRTRDPVLRLALDIGADETFDLLLEAYQEIRGDGTPAELAELMVELGGVSGRDVHDPACGAGTMLAVACAAGASSVAGQDSNETSAAMARVRLAFVRMPACASTKDIRSGDLRHDAYEGEQFDVVLCHPPFAARDWGVDALAYDPRWVYGVPARQESELAWVQHALAHTRPGGTAVVVVPPAVATRASGRRVRAELLRRGALHTVASMPPGMAAPAQLSLQLWLLSPPIGPAGEVLLVDGAALTSAELAAAVASSGDATACAARVSVVDLLDDEVDLTPARHVAGRTTGPAAADVLAAWDRVTTMLRALPASLPALTATRATSAAEVPMTTLADLVRAGSLTIHSQAGTPVVDGDVIVPAQGAELTAEVATTASTLGPGRALLRPRPDRLDSWFLAGAVARPSNVRLATSLGSTLRLDLRRARVPRIPLERQRDYAETFRALHTLRRNLIVAADDGRAVIDLVAEGLAAGAVGPNEISIQDP